MLSLLLMPSDEKPEIFRVLFLSEGDERFLVAFDEFCYAVFAPLREVSGCLFQSLTL